jgi:hypothetical protein
LYFAPEQGGSDAACQWSPDFAFGQEYLIFRNKDGTLDRWFGRAAEIVPGRDDAWLIAIRRLVADPRRKYGRVATIPEVLSSAAFVVEGVTDKCPMKPPPPPPQPGDRRPSTAEFTGHRIVRQLWGTPVEHTDRLDDLLWLDRDECRVGERRLGAYFYDGGIDAEFLRLRVSDGKVDFSGLANGTERGIIDANSRYGLWYAQVELPAKLVWSVEELASALNDVAMGTYQAGGGD